MGCCKAKWFKTFSGFGNVAWKDFLNSNIFIVNRLHFPVFSQCNAVLKKYISRKILKDIGNSKLSSTYYCFTIKRNKNYVAVLILCFLLQMNEDSLS